MYLLVGDHGLPSDAMTVSGEGRMLTHLATLLATEGFQWLTFTVDGGASGRDVDLGFAAADDGCGEGLVVIMPLPARPR